MHGNTFEPSRRTVLKTVGIGIAAGVGTSGIGGAQDADWEEAETPTGATITGVVPPREGPYAVGEGGLVLARRIDGWETILETGPTTAENESNDAAVTDDGRHVWFCGGSGVVAQYDALRNRLTDYTGPTSEDADEGDEKTTTWTALDAVGTAGEERVVLANGSGEALPGEYVGDGVEWGQVVKPGGGSSAGGAALFGSETAYASDTTSKVYRSDDAGGSWETIGIDGASVDLTDVDAANADDVNAAGGDGSIFRYNGAVWMKLAVGGDALRGIARRLDRGLAAGGSGAAFTRTLYGWEEDETPVEADLHDVVTDDTLDVAVGDSGTIVERGRR